MFIKNCLFQKLWQVDSTYIIALLFK